jgi:phage terminase small subunit
MASSFKKPFAKGLAGSDLTSMQRQFVITLVRHGCTPTQAARDAGYADPKVSAHDLLRTAHIQNAVRFERLRHVQSDLANIATSTLREVMVDKAAPASARVQAARTVLEISGDISKTKSHDQDDRPLSELSADDLTRLIDQWQCERAGLAQLLPDEDEDIADAIERAQLAH